MEFYIGQEIRLNGLLYRVLPGNRCEGDMIIEWKQVSPGEWHRPTIAHTLLLIDFKRQVEENNYGVNGKIKRGKGVKKLLEAIYETVKNGWETEAKKIEEEVRIAKMRRRFG